MVHTEQAPLCDAEHYPRSLLPFPVDQASYMEEGQCWYGDTILAASGFSEAQTNGIYNVTANPQIDASADFFNHNPLKTDPLFDLFEVKNYDSSFDIPGLPFNRSHEISGNGGLDNFEQLNHWMPKEETASSRTYMDIEWQQAESPTFQLQAVNMNGAHDLQSDVKEEADTSCVSPISPKPLTSMSRENRERSEVETRRRSIISQRVQALQELLPETLKDKRCNQESVLHDVFGQIKYLQLQVKELSRSRLVGESNSGPLKFVEGYGHYYPHAKKFDEPLEEILGSLLEENPAAAHKILESSGLYMLPVALVDSLISSKG